jgi:carboxyl-terminal processing protease
MNSRIKLTVMTLSTCLVIMLLWGAAVGQTASADDTYRHLGVYTEVLSKIKSDYVEEPDLKNVTLGALNGLLESIDPYASYLNPDQYKQYLATKDNKLAGVGMVISKKFGYVGVVDVIPETSAAKAGLNTGDFIESINGVSTRDMPLAYAEHLLKGPPGTTVDVSVMRIRRSEPQKTTLTRAPLTLPKVTAKMLPDGIGHIQVESMEQGKAREVASALQDLEKQGAKKVILDLRNSAYGTPLEGASVADLFLDSGTMTYLQGQKVARENSDAKPADTVFKGPLVVVTNRGTANGAEIAAAALLDNKRAEVVGDRTYGDAAVRRAISMEDGSAVILSVAKYYSPSGKAIQDTGVTPTVQIAETEPFVDAEEDTTAEPQPKPSGEDVILKKAIEVLTKGVPASERVAGPTPQSTAPGGDDKPKPLTTVKPEK